MPVDDSRLRELCSELGLGYYWQTEQIGTNHTCRIVTDRDGKPYREARTYPIHGEQAAFNDALESLISVTEWRTKSDLGAGEKE